MANEQNLKPGEYKLSKETALDIARTTGYVVEPKYVDLIAKSLNQTAEMLIK